MKKVAISGYFNPIHSGHIDYIREAKALGTHLTVILNTDHQVEAKGSVPFMDLEERAYILNAMADVDEVVPAVDKDKTVCKTLEYLKPDIFANGGDRFADNIPEKKLCDKLGIEMVFNVGGKKAQSSSNLIRRALENTLTEYRPWGYFTILGEGHEYKVKKLLVHPGKRLSLQSHKYREEDWMCVTGHGKATVDGKEYDLRHGKRVSIPLGAKHRLENVGEEDFTIVEVQTGKYLGEDDIVRYEDDFDRIK